MVRSLDRQAPEQIGPDPVLGVRIAGARRPIDCLKPHQAHQPSGPGVGRSARPRGAGEVPSDGRRRTGTSGTARRSAASARASPRSPPSARSRARSARATAGGIVGSGSAPGGRAQSSCGRSDRLIDRLIDRTRAIKNPAPRSTPRSWRENRGPRSHGPRTRRSVPFENTSTRPSIAWALPGTDLVRVDLVLRGDLLKRPVAPKRLQRHLRLQLPLKTSVVCCSSAFLRQAVEYTLATCPIFRRHLTHYQVNLSL